MACISDAGQGGAMPVATRLTGNRMRIRDSRQ